MIACVVCTLLIVTNTVTCPCCGSRQPRRKTIIDLVDSNEETNLMIAKKKAKPRRPKKKKRKRTSVYCYTWVYSFLHIIARVLVVIPPTPTVYNTCATRCMLCMVYIHTTPTLYRILRQQQQQLPPLQQFPSVYVICVAHGYIVTHGYIPFFI